MTGFGEKILKNLGWNKGDGLGKNKDGMLNPIRVSLKSDTRGLGASVIAKKDPATWNSIYENALNGSADSEIEKLFKKSDDHGKVAVQFVSSQQVYHNSITVNTSEEGALRSEKGKRKSKKDDNSYPAVIHDAEIIEECKPRKRKHSKNLSNAQPESASKTSSEICKKKKNQDSTQLAAELQIPANTQSGLGMSDAELFEFCRGRTCHPAARFGNKLSGKLARISKL